MYFLFYAYIYIYKSRRTLPKALVHLCQMNFDPKQHILMHIEPHNHTHALAPKIKLFQSYATHAIFLHTHKMLHACTHTYMHVPTHVHVHTCKL